MQIVNINSLMKVIEYIPSNTVAVEFIGKPKGSITFGKYGLSLLETGFAEKYEISYNEDESLRVKDMFKEKYFNKSFFTISEVNGIRAKFRSYKVQFEDQVHRIDHYNVIICDSNGENLESIFIKDEAKAIEIVEAFKEWII